MNTERADLVWTFVKEFVKLSCDLDFIVYESSFHKINEISCRVRAGTALYKLDDES